MAKNSEKKKRMVERTECPSRSSGGGGSLGGRPEEEEEEEELPLQMSDPLFLDVGECVPSLRDNGL